MGNLKAIQFGEGAEATYLIVEGSGDKPSGEDIPLIQIRIFEGIGEYTFADCVVILEQVLQQFKKEMQSEKE